jgi:hypothetical protein
VRIPLWGSGEQTSCDNRTAYVFHRERVANGELLFMVYEKYGSASNVAIRWVENPSFVGQSVEGGQVGDALFEESGNRHFRCTCGRTERVTKSEWKQYKAGEALQIICGACGASGTVHTDVEVESTTLVVVASPKVDLKAALMAKWGK